MRALPCHVLAPICTQRLRPLRAARLPRAERSRKPRHNCAPVHRHVEMVRTDGLLTDMMPPSVLSKLKEGLQVADELHGKDQDTHTHPRSPPPARRSAQPAPPPSPAAGVLLLYSDLQGFTAMAAECTPAQVVSSLEQLYTAFDALVHLLDLFKVQTIGDAYIVMSHQPHPGRRPSAGGAANCSRGARQHKARADCEAMLQMAFGMVAELRRFRAPHGKRLQMRIGIHYGTVTAGVIGRTKLRYDIFGSDALLGNALEAEGIPGGVCVSDRVLPLMRHLPRYAVYPHREVQLREHGELIGAAQAFAVRDLLGERDALEAAQAAEGAETAEATALDAGRRRPGPSSPSARYRFTSAVSGATRSLLSPGRAVGPPGSGARHATAELELVRTDNF